MMNDHSDKGSYHYRRFKLNQSAVELALPDIVTKKLINTPDVALPEHVSELVLLKRRMQQEPMEFRIAFVMLERSIGEISEDRVIVLACYRVRDGHDWIEAGIATGFVIENRCIQLFLGGEVSKHHRFRHTGCMGDFACCRSVKSFPGEKIYRDLKDLHAPLFARHTRGSSDVAVKFRGINLLAQLGSLLTPQRAQAPKVSTYLPPGHGSRQVCSPGSAGILACMPTTRLRFRIEMIVKKPMQAGMPALPVTPYRSRSQNKFRAYSFITKLTRNNNSCTASLANLS